MSRSSFTIAASIGAALSTLVIAGCGTTETGPVIAPPPQAALAAGNASVQSALAAFAQAMQSQLNAAASTTTSGVVDLAAETNALASDGNLIAAERIDALKSLGAKTAGDLEATVRSLMSTASGDGSLNSTYVDGTSIGATLRSILGSALANVESLASEIATTSLPDVLRNDDQTLASSKIYGFLDPQAHTLIAGGDALAEANNLSATAQALTAQVNGTGSGSDPNYNAEVGLLTQLHDAIGSTSSIAVSAIRQVRGLTADNFPGNASALNAARQSLTQLTLPNGPTNTALSTIDQIKFLLAQRG